MSHRLPAATADTLAETALRSVGRLDVLSSTPAAASVALLVCAASRPFREATGEKCGLAAITFEVDRAFQCLRRNARSGKFPE